MVVVVVQRPPNNRFVPDVICQGVTYRFVKLLKDEIGLVDIKLPGDNKLIQTFFESLTQHRDAIMLKYARHGEKNQPAADGTPKIFSFLPKITGTECGRYKVKCGTRFRQDDRKTRSRGKAPAKDTTIQLGSKA